MQLGKYLILLFSFLAFSLSAIAQSGNYARPLRINDSVYNLTQEAFARVKKISSQDNITVLFLTGRFSGQAGEGWGRSDLALQEGCNKGICVDDRVYLVDKDANVEVVAISMKGQFVVRYLDGKFKGQTGSQWEVSDLAIMKGCSKKNSSLCVGKTVKMKEGGAQATIYALESDGDFVLKFVTGRYKDQVGHGWTSADFVLLEEKTGSNSDVGNASPNPVTNTPAPVTVKPTPAPTPAKPAPIPTPIKPNPTPVAQPEKPSVPVTPSSSSSSSAAKPVVQPGFKVIEDLPL